MMFSKHSSYVSASLISLIIKLQMQKKIVVFFLEFNIHLFTVDLFQYMTKEKNLYFMWKLINTRAAVVRYIKTPAPLFASDLRRGCYNCRSQDKRMSGAWQL